MPRIARIVAKNYPHHITQRGNYRQTVFTKDSDYRYENSLAKTFNASHMRYAHYFNKRNSLTGHLWQGRFYSCVLGDNHLYATVRYVENNPVRAKLVKKAWDWNWSSAKEHMKKERGI